MWIELRFELTCSPIKYNVKLFIFLHKFHSENFCFMVLADQFGDTPHSMHEQNLASKFIVVTAVLKNAKLRVKMAWNNLSLWHTVIPIRHFSVKLSTPSSSISMCHSLSKIGHGKTLQFSHFDCLWFLKIVK